MKNFISLSNDYYQLVLLYGDQILNCLSVFEKECYYAYRFNHGFSKIVFSKDSNSDLETIIQNILKGKFLRKFYNDHIYLNLPTKNKSKIDFFRFIDLYELDSNCKFLFLLTKEEEQYISDELCAHLVGEKQLLLPIDKISQIKKLLISIKRNELKKHDQIQYEKFYYVK